MVSMPDVADLRLVQAVAAFGSLAGAARELGVTQPSASQRLARLERRAGAVLFERDTRGARPTAAGAELVRQAAHVLDRLEHSFAAAREAGTARTLVLGTIASLATTVLPVVAEHLDDDLEQRVEHGPLLLAGVAEGTVDAAVVAVAERLRPDPVLRLHPLGSDPLVVLVPDGVPGPGAGREPWRARRVVLATYDGRVSEAAALLGHLGALPARAATVGVALAQGRRRGLPVVVPRSSLAHTHDGDRVETLPRHPRARITLVTGRHPDPRLEGLPGLLAAALGLDLDHPEGRHQPGLAART